MDWTTATLREKLPFLPIVALAFIVLVSFVQSRSLIFPHSSFYMYGPTRPFTTAYLVILFAMSIAPIVFSVKKWVFLSGGTFVFASYFIFHIEYSMFLQLALSKLQNDFEVKVGSSPFDLPWAFLLLVYFLLIMSLTGTDRRYFFAVNVALALISASAAFNSYWSWLGILSG